MQSARDPRGDRSAIEQRIAAARQGSTRDLGVLLDEFRNYLLLIANAELDSELRKKVGASDVVQETFLLAQAGFAAFHGVTEPELRAWLRQIMINRCRNVRQAYEAGSRIRLFANYEVVTDSGYAHCPCRDQSRQFSSTGITW